LRCVAPCHEQAPRAELRIDPRRNTARLYDGTPIPMAAAIAAAGLGACVAHRLVRDRRGP
jgi:hypothetical protein